MKKIIQDITDRILEGRNIDFAAASELARAQGADLWDLFAAAGRVRGHYRGNTVDICSIVNAKSGDCTEDCAYCAQSAHHSTGAPVYPLISVDRMAEAAESAKKNMARRFCIVTSGRGVDSDDDLEKIAQGIRRVRDIGLSPCATLGALTRDQLSYLKNAGLRRFHHNIETSREYFPRICTTHTFDERLEVLGHARSVGLSTCSGGIFGMGEAMEDRIRMALTLRGINVDSVPINFLMPIMGTPLEHVEAITPLEALHSIALFRMILPEKEIRVCAGRGSALRRLHPLIFSAGADGFMIGNYLTTSGPDPGDDLRMIQDLGLQT
ncbi:MAG TPA: biotin synthase BioB [Nitrospirota bacterium]